MPDWLLAALIALVPSSAVALIAWGVQSQKTKRLEQDVGDDRKHAEKAVERITALEREMSRQQEKAHGLANAIQVLGEKMDAMSEKMDKLIQALLSK